MRILSALPRWKGGVPWLIRGKNSKFHKLIYADATQFCLNIWQKIAITPKMKQQWHIVEWG